VLVVCVSDARHRGNETDYGGRVAAAYAVDEHGDDEEGACGRETGGEAADDEGADAEACEPDVFADCSAGLEKPFAYNGE
jgi:hypothetical protein